MEEQLSILTNLQAPTEPITQAIARTEHEIALLREYRTRLTADVVTGKLDVREAATGLPESEDDETQGELKVLPEYSDEDAANSGTDAEDMIG